ncbi:MAG: hypothetical protein U0903_15755 [Planctomycetales bacterium]
MDVWQIVLYGGAAVLALKCLSGLMVSHKRSYLEQAIEEEKRRARAAKKQQKEAAAAPKPGAASKPGKAA